MRYDINLDDARIGYKPDGNFSRVLFVKKSRKLNSRRAAFSSYSPAYMSSNEQLQSIMQILKPVGKNVLAVTASGDAPLFFTAYGAQHVDTFDISYNARVVMDIKTYMLKNNFCFYDYVHVLRDIQTAPDVLNCVSGDVVMHAVTHDTLDYLRGMRGCRIFMRTSKGEIACFPDRTEFAAMKQNVRGRYNFIWSDLFDLSGRITDKKYDIIYLSNVLQFVNATSDIVAVLNNMRAHLNTDGVIVVDSLLQSLAVARHKKYKSVGDNISGWADLIYDKSAMTMFLKTR
ncbi:MAG: hypothetical protein ACLRFM_00005 [Alphaproteobacteria bacterium]